MIERSIRALQQYVGTRIWVISDLQQSDPVRAEEGMACAVGDMLGMERPPDYIWYLGDATEGADPDRLDRMSRMQVSYLSRLAAPVRYVLGNHEFDYFRQHLGSRDLDPEEAFPFAGLVRKQPGWRTTDRPETFYFTEDIGSHLVVFLSDHADSLNRWYCSHGGIHGESEAYPYDDEAYEALRRLIRDSTKPVITASHYAFSGGARPSAVLDRLLPLPDRVQLHLHGHAHIGDAHWAGKDAHRKFAAIDGHDIVQVNVSSLEDRRGSAVRSCVLDIYDDASIGLHMREHTRKQWTESLLLHPDRRSPRRQATGGAADN